MPSALSICPDCGLPGRWGLDDDWCHEDADTECPREGYFPGFFPEEARDA